MSNKIDYTSPFKDNILKGKVVLVTGGASGIGYEISKQYGLHGCSIHIMGRRNDVLVQAVNELQKLGITASSTQGDVRNSEHGITAVRDCIKQYSRLDILVNCAAGNFLSPAQDLSPKGFRTVIEIDTIGTFNLCHAAFNELKKHGDGLIINITATLQTPATWYQSHASAAKSAVDSLTRSLALEWGEYGIRVCGIAPGPIRDTTGMAKLGAGRRPDADIAIPLRRWGTKWDIALCCVYLGSNAGNLITGDTLIVDGGAVLYRPAIADREQIRAFSKAAEKSSKNVGLPQAKL